MLTNTFTSALVTQCALLLSSVVSCVSAVASHRHLIPADTQLVMLQLDAEEVETTSCVDPQAAEDSADPSEELFAMALWTFEYNSVS